MKEPKKWQYYICELDNYNQASGQITKEFLTKKEAEGRRYCFRDYMSALIVSQN